MLDGEGRVEASERAGRGGKFEFNSRGKRDGGTRSAEKVRVSTCAINNCGRDERTEKMLRIRTTTTTAAPEIEIETYASCSTGS